MERINKWLTAAEVRHPVVFRLGAAALASAVAGLVAALALDQADVAACRRLVGHLLSGL